CFMASNGIWKIPPSSGKWSPPCGRRNGLFMPSPHSVAARRSFSSTWYLARYTHRVAISNYRLIGIEDGKVHFYWKDYADGNRQKTMALDGVEFIRRFLLHVVPSGFMRIRHFGFLAHGHRTEKLELCRR